MPRAYPQTKFSKGEVSPSFHGRADAVSYQEGLAEATNVYVKPTGGIEKRPGTWFIAPFSVSGNVKLFSFKFREGDHYVMPVISGHTVDGDNIGATILFYREGAPILDAEDEVVLQGSTSNRYADLDPDDTSVPSGTIEGVYEGPGGASSAIVYLYSSDHGLEDDDFIQTSIDTSIPGLANQIFNVKKVNNHLFCLNNFSLNNGRQVDLSDLSSSDSFKYKKLYSVKVPYDSWVKDNEIFDVKLSQSADTVTFTHINYNPLSIKRMAHNNWEQSFGDIQERSINFPAISELTGSVSDNQAIDVNLSNLNNDYADDLQGNGSLSASSTVVQSWRGTSFRGNLSPNTSSALSFTSGGRTELKETDRLTLIIQKGVSTAATVLTDTISGNRWKDLDSDTPDSLLVSVTLYPSDIDEAYIISKDGNDFTVQKERSKVKKLRYSVTAVNLDNNEETLPAFSEPGFDFNLSPNPNGQNSSIATVDDSDIDTAVIQRDVAWENYSSYDSVDSRDDLPTATSSTVGAIYYIIDENQFVTGDSSTSSTITYVNATRFTNHCFGSLSAAQSYSCASSISRTGCTGLTFHSSLLYTSDVTCPPAGFRVRCRYSGKCLSSGGTVTTYSWSDTAVENFIGKFSTDSAAEEFATRVGDVAFITSLGGFRIVTSFASDAVVIDVTGTDINTKYRWIQNNGIVLVDSKYYYFRYIDGYRILIQGLRVTGAKELKRSFLEVDIKTRLLNESITTTSGDVVTTSGQSPDSVEPASVSLQWQPVSSEEGDFLYKVYRSNSNGSELYLLDVVQGTVYEDYPEAPRGNRFYVEHDEEDRVPTLSNLFFNDTPATVAYFNQRKVFANTFNHPDTLYFSAINSFSDFQLGTKDNDSIHLTLGSDRISPINALVPLQDLFIFTSDTVWRLSLIHISEPTRPY